MQGSSQELQTSVLVIVESAIFITTCFWKSKRNNLYIAKEAL